MLKKSGTLVAALGPQLAKQLSGSGAGANTAIIDGLPDVQRLVVRKAFADSLQPMWAMYTAFAGAGIIASIFVKKKVLSREHQETKTGLEAEREKAHDLAEAKEAKRASKRASHAGSSARTSGRFSRPTTSGTGAASDTTEVPPMPAMLSREDLAGYEMDRYGGARKLEGP